ncbi:MAG: Kelch repeat-containing protein, partial [Planctomycetota bacterium]
MIAAPSEPPMPNQPRGRYKSVTVYDPFRRRMIIIGGGRGGINYNDVYAMGLAPGLPATNWVTLSPTPPVMGTAPSRWAASGVFCPSRDAVILFGGHQGGLASPTSTNDLYELSFRNSTNGAWANITPTGSTPGPRGEAAFAFDPYNQRMIVVGGRDGTTSLYTDAWACTLRAGRPASWLYLPPEGIPGLWGTSGIFDAVNQRMVYCFGTNGSANNSAALSIPLRSLEVEFGWRPLDPGTFSMQFPRWKHAMAYDPGTKKILLFGGQNITSPYMGDTYSADVTAAFSWQSEGILNPPAARRGHVMVTDPRGRRILMWGGESQMTTFRNDLWELKYDGNTGGFVWNPQTLPSPNGRHSAAACYDSLNHWMVIYGGRGLGGLNDELDILDLKSMTWNPLGPQTIGGPGNLAEACAVYDPEGGVMVLFGGDGGATLSNSAWVLDLKSVNLAAPGVQPWTQVSTPVTRPTRRKGCGGYWDAPNHRAVFFGGELGAGGVDREVWALNLNGHTTQGDAYGMWKQLLPFGSQPPLARSHCPLVWDPENLRAIGCGGRNGSGADLGSTYDLVPPTPTLRASMSLVATGFAQPRREGHAAVMDRPNDRMLIFGGRDGPTSYRADLRALTNASQ